MGLLHREIVPPGKHCTSLENSVGSRAGVHRADQPRLSHPIKEAMSRSLVEEAPAGGGKVTNISTVDGSIYDCRWLLAADPPSARNLCYRYTPRANAPMVKSSLAMVSRSLKT
jgi:hypothetical protein